MQYKKILVVAAHPDDEMLGCGGMLARFGSEGATVRVLLLGEGPLARGYSASDTESVKDDAITSALRASEVLGIKDVRFGNLSDNKFDSVPLLEIIKIIERETSDFEPDLILTHHAGDLNIDHCATHRAVLTVFRPLPNTKPCSIMGFEVLSSTEWTPHASIQSFHPNTYFNISEFLEMKLKALHEYASEMRDSPHPRSYEGVTHLAKLRGVHCGHGAAEAFVLYRSVM